MIAWVLTESITLPGVLSKLSAIQNNAMVSTTFQKQVQGVYPITVAEGFTVNYRLMTWNPMPGHEYTEKKFEEIRQASNCHWIHYAVDYDRHHTFHINTWPAVKNALRTRDI